MRGEQKGDFGAKNHPRGGEDGQGSLVAPLCRGRAGKGGQKITKSQCGYGNSAYRTPWAECWTD